MIPVFVSFLQNHWQQPSFVASTDLPRKFVESVVVTSQQPPHDKLPLELISSHETLSEESYDDDDQWSSEAGNSLGVFLSGEADESQDEPCQGMHLSVKEVS